MSKAEAGDPEKGKRGPAFGDPTTSSVLAREEKDGPEGLPERRGEVVLPNPGNGSGFVLENRFCLPNHKGEYMQESRGRKGIRPVTRLKRQRTEGAIQIKAEGVSPPRNRLVGGGGRASSARSTCGGPRGKKTTSFPMEEGQTWGWT